MEYLINVRGLEFEQVMADSVILENTYQEMMDWRKSMSIQEKDNRSITNRCKRLADCHAFCK